MALRDLKNIFWFFFPLGTKGKIGTTEILFGIPEALEQASGLLLS
jgi:hypothetical protein